MSSEASGQSGMVGQVIGGYRLESEIGRGATGVVFRARRLDETPAEEERTGLVALERPDEAAIKVLELDRALDAKGQQDFQERFKREINTLTRLRHPNIVPLLGSGMRPEQPASYMILPYMAGGTLQNRLSERGPLPFNEVAADLDAIAAALDYAHGQGVVHRDIKPANILLDEQGRVYIADFSIVRLLDETQSGLTSTRGVMATPEYMAPEQIERHDIGPATDIYGLGMLAYALVTGRPAFTGPIVPLIRQVTQEAPTPPTTLRPDLPRPAEAAILQALAKDPTQRFSSAAAFAHAFANGLLGQWSDGLSRFIAPGGVPVGGLPTPAEAAAVTMPPGLATGARLSATAHTPANRDGGRPSDPARLALIAVAALLLIACVAGSFFVPGSPVLAFLAPHTPTAGSGGLAQVATHTATTRSVRPTATTKKSNGGSTSKTGGGGGGNPGNPAPTATFTPTPTATFTPTPTATFTPTPTPTNTPVVRSIQIGWSTKYQTWIWMTVNNFSSGTYTYYCTFSTPPASYGYLISITSSPESWDNGKTCYDAQHGDQIWVVINGVSSNRLTVP